MYNCSAHFISVLCERSKINATAADFFDKCLQECLKNMNIQNRVTSRSTDRVDVEKQAKTIMIILLVIALLIIFVCPFIFARCIRRDFVGPNARKPIPLCGRSLIPDFCHYRGCCCLCYTLKHLWIQLFNYYSSFRKNTPPATTGNVVMYHGTTKESALAILRHGFLPSRRGILGPGVYLSRDRGKAVGFADPILITVKVDVGRCLEVQTGKNRSWHQNGFDSAWIPKGEVNSIKENQDVWKVELTAKIRFVLAKLRCIKYNTV